MMYKIPDKITDFLALFGLMWIVQEAWRELEIWLYGTSQKSSVDAVVAFFICLFCIVALRVWSANEHEEL